MILENNLTLIKLCVVSIPIGLITYVRKNRVKTGNVKKSTLPGRIRSISSVISADVNLIL